MASTALGGTTQKCKGCEKTVYLVDQLTADGKIFHKSCFQRHHCKGTLKVSIDGSSCHRPCFKCAHGGCVITPSNCAAHEGKLCCKHPHTQLFMTKGDFSQLGDKHENIATTGVETPHCH